MHETEWGLYRHLMPDDSKESKHEFYLKYGKRNQCGTA